MKYVVKIPVVVEQENGNGIPRHHFACVRVTAKDISAAVGQVEAAIARLNNPEPMYDSARDW